VYIVLSALTLLLVFGALIDVITREDWQVQHLPKLTWVFIVILLPVIGSIIWFAVGRDWGGTHDAIPFGDPRRQEAAIDRVTGTSAADRAAIDAAVEAEMRLAEKEARVRRLEAEVRARRDQQGGGAAS
jgi:hypothetical protein